MTGNSTAALVAPPAVLVSSASSAARPPLMLPSPAGSANSMGSGVNHHQTSHTGLHATAGSSSSMSVDTYCQPLTPQTGYGSSDSHIRRSDSASSYTLSPPKPQAAAVYGSSSSSSSSSSSHPQTSYGQMATQTYHQNAPFSPSQLGRNPPSGQPVMGPEQMSTSGTGGTGAAYPASTALAGPSSMNTTAYASHQSLQLSSALPPPGCSNPTLPYANGGITGLDSSSGVVAPGSAVGDSGFDSMAPYAYPVFGGETYHRSPFAMADDFTAWLFNEPLLNNSSPVAYSPTSGVMRGYSDPSQLYYTGDAAYGGSYLTNVVPQHPMSVTSILDPGPPQAIMSEEKRQELLHLITGRFNEPSHSAISKRKDALLDGDIDADDHVLSLRMMQTYIGAYWYHFHPQLPILHKPTFAADKTPNLLLLAIMAIGASNLDRIHGQEVTEKAADLADLVAWHLRWEIFMDADFRPPARLWVFQALLLLEIYEKMYSTRALHERAHIHHDTTLTLMRRGSSLIGRCAFDTPSSARESGIDESWAHWIKTEATRRVAFAAFVLDSTHATMFGHSAKMVAHELRLPLPCDEALWSATSAAEVARVQASLHANGIRPTMFLDGLKKTLNGQKVRTNAFGRTIIMAGLLSVSWHMNQRDLQVSSLGVAQALGGRDRWRSALLRAFDNWKRDFDETLAESSLASYSNPYRQQYPVDDDIISESRTVLHHLAHMASHVDIMDCQIFAGAGRLLGRSITPKDYSTAREKMTERWATKASARDATFYALKLLSQVLLGDDGSPDQGAQEYSARDDFLLNRPWVLYFAALVVWSYGYALEGPITPSPPVLATPADQRRDMREFLRRVGGVREPNDLETITGRNRCLGLLMTLRDSFAKTRWELLQEAANLLDSCIQKLKTPVVGRPV